jgi:Trypsin
MPIQGVTEFFIEISQRLSAPIACGAIFLSTACADSGVREQVPEESVIVGGQAISPAVAKVTVFFRSRSSCTGTMLSSYQILTAAHCVVPNLNEHSLAEGEELPLSFQKSPDPKKGRKSLLTRVTKIDVHPSWIAAMERTSEPIHPGGDSGKAAEDPTTSDVAVIHLASNVSGAIAEVDPEPVAAKSLVQIVGGGCTSDGKDASGNLLQVTRPVVEARATRYHHARTDAAGAVRGTCPGDSGGPVFRITLKGELSKSAKGNLLVVGVTSASTDTTNLTARLATPAVLTWLNVALAATKSPAVEVKTVPAGD